MFGAILNSKVINNQLQNANNMALKGILVYSLKAELRKQSVTLFDLSQDCVCVLSEFMLVTLSMSLDDHKSATGLDSGVTHEF